MSDDWEVQIEPSTIGRGYHVYLTKGFLYYGPWPSYRWHTWTLRGAIRKGQRELARLQRQEARTARTAEKIRKAGLR